MDDRELKDLLQRIPRATAPPGFAARVAQRLDAADRRIRIRRRAGAALSLAAAVAITAGAGLYTWQQRAERLERARLTSLEGQYRDLEEELVELQRMVAAAQPVVGVEGPGERGYLVDVGELARARADGAVPVAYRLPH